MGLLLTFLPESCWILLILGAGICLMLGFRQFALGLLFTIILLALAIPFVDSAFEAAFAMLDAPLQGLLMGALMIVGVLWLISLVFGQGAKDQL